MRQLELRGAGTGGGGEDASTPTHLDATAPGVDSGSKVDAGDAADAVPSDLDAAGAAGANATSYAVTSVQLQGACAGSACLCLPQPLPVDGAGHLPCGSSSSSRQATAASMPGPTQARTRMPMAAATAARTRAPAQAARLPQVLARRWGSRRLRRTSSSPSSRRATGRRRAPSACSRGMPSAEWVQRVVQGFLRPSARAGACYGTGAAAGTCQEVLLTTPAGLPPAGSLALLGCGETAPDAGGQGVDATSVGTACIPSQERVATFGGFNQRAVTLDENNAACPGAVCLVNHFQGLTTCPYGQDTEAHPANGGAVACSVRNRRARATRRRGRRRDGATVVHRPPSGEHRRLLLSLRERAGPDRRRRVVLRVPHRLHLQPGRARDRERRPARRWLLHRGRDGVRSRQRLPHG